MLFEQLIKCLSHSRFLNDNIKVNLETLKIDYIMTQIK